MLGAKIKYAALGLSTGYKNLFVPWSLFTRQAETPVTVLFNPYSQSFLKTTSPHYMEKNAEDSTHKEMLE